MNYDFAILGGGAAGLSLALELVNSPLEQKSILIVEKDSKTTNDRTWCFWTDQPTRYDGIARRAWPRLRFQSDEIDQIWNLAPLHYEMVRGLDFYNFARSELEKHTVTFVHGLGDVEDGQEKVAINVGGESFAAEWAFDSRIRPSDVVPNLRRYNYLKQHFTGWEIETAAPVFNPQTVTMFDLRTPQRGGVTFFYILPFSPTNALVEYTLFSPEVLPDDEYAEALRGYLSATLGLKAYNILASEHGVVPMTDQPFPRRIGRRILAIGTRGGRVKPSTGYAFARIQRDSNRIVNSLLNRGHPFAISPDPLRYRFYDGVILEVFAKRSALGRSTLAAIFTKNPAQRVLKFLDDSSSPWEDLQILSSPPAGSFLQVIGNKTLERVFRNEKNRSNF
ncbi:MAG: lycopene cyclase family protein [Anaerolineales bacterium]